MRQRGPSIAEMEVIRAKDSELRRKEAKNFVPEKNESKALAYFEISRYTKGQFMGSFIVTQYICDDSKGNPLAEPIKKVVSDGVDMVVAMSSLETAIRRRVFR